jgi:hypothetical protein
MSSKLTVADVRKVAMALPRTEEHLIRGQVKFRIRSIVYVALSLDALTMGFAFPKELRSALVDGEPEKFLLPRASDLRFNWVCVRLSAIDARELRTLVTEAWRMVVPRSVARGLSLPRGLAGLSAARQGRPPRSKA